MPNTWRGDGDGKPRAPGGNRLGAALAVVRPDAKRRGRRRRRRAKRGGGERLGVGQVRRGGPAGEFGPALVAGRGGGPEPAAAGRVDVDGACALDQVKTLVNDGNAHGAPNLST